VTVSDDYGFVGYGLAGDFPPAPVDGLIAYARSIGRRYFPGRIEWFDFFGNPAPSGDIRMLPVPWPAALTADQWGVSYPSDIWLLPMVVGRSGSGSYSDQWADFWKAGIEATSSEAYGVPKVLPVGYTPRLKRDWHWHGVGDGFHSVAGANGVTWWNYKIRTATGYDLYPWTPDPAPYGYTGSLDTATAPQVGLTSFGYHAVGVGYRKVQYQISNPGVGLIWSGDAVINLSHNADGSIGSTTADGDTIDYTNSVAPGAFTLSGGGAATAWIDAGQQLPTLGVPSFFKCSLDLSAITGGSVSGDFVVSFRLSPRLDVPMPFTSTARGAVIAPGGTV
jgi:hypothetical protein